MTEYWNVNTELRNVLTLEHLFGPSIDSSRDNRIR